MLLNKVKIKPTTRPGLINLIGKQLKYNKSIKKMLYQMHHAGSHSQENVHRSYKKKVYLSLNLAYILCKSDKRYVMNTLLSNNF